MLLGGWEPVSSWAMETSVCVCSISSYTLGWAFLATRFKFIVPAFNATTKLLLYTLVKHQYLSQTLDDSETTKNCFWLGRQSGSRWSESNLASSPGSLLKNRGKREPGNIRGNSCRLPAPCSSSTNQIAERNHRYTWHFVHSAKICQLDNELISIDYTLKV